MQDYAALITISDPSQLTQELINDKLGLQYHVQHVASNTPMQVSPEERKEPARVPSLKKDILPPTPQAASIPQSTAASLGNGQPPTSFHSPQQHQASPTTAPIQAYHESSSMPQRSRDVSASGSAGDTGPDRPRKVSLTARLGKAFGNPSQQSSTASQSPSGSPGSPSSTSKFKSSFSKAFRRTSADTEPSSTRSDRLDAPPVPPKDEQLHHQAHSANDAHPSQTSTSQRITSAGIGQSATSAVPSPRSDSLPSNPQPLRANGTFTPASAAHSNTATLNHSSPLPQDNHLSPSPSAQRVFQEARIKSVNQEEEIQARFRRDLYVDDSGPSSQRIDDGVDDQEEDLRLPYDMSDDQHSNSGHVANQDPESRAAEEIPQALQLGRPLSGHAADRQVSNDVPDPASQDDSTVRAADVVDTEDEARQAENDNNAEEERVAREHEESRHLEEQRRLEEERQAAEAEASRTRELEDQRRRDEEEALRIREEEEYRVREQEEQRLRQAEEDERARVVEEERVAREAEARRIQEEEDARRKEEEEEKLRKALEEQRRMEEARLREEEVRRQEEEARRVEAEKQEAERVRKESIKQTLREGKTNGSVMLRGVSVLLPCRMRSNAKREIARHRSDDKESDLASAAFPITIRRDAFIQG